MGEGRVVPARGQMIGTVDPLLAWCLLVGYVALGVAVTAYLVQMARVIWADE